MVKRGEVWLAVLDPTVGAEIQKTRPCLVISPSVINENLGVVSVAPMTSGSRPAAFRIAVEFRGVKGLVLTEQSRAVDKRRLVKRLGDVPDPVLKAVLRTLRSFYAD